MMNHFRVTVVLLSLLLLPLFFVVDVVSAARTWKVGDNHDDVNDNEGDNDASSSSSSTSTFATTGPPVTLADTCSMYLAPSTLYEHYNMNNQTIQDMYGSIHPDHMNVGFGVYAFVDIPANTVLTSEMFQPIYDPYKTLPYRSQQRFKSWLRYIWPVETNEFFPSRYDGSYPTIPSYLNTRFGSRKSRSSGSASSSSTSSSSDASSSTTTTSTSSGSDSSGNIHNDFGLNDADGLQFEHYNPYRRKYQKVSAFAPGLTSLVNHAPTPYANIGRINAGREDDDDDEDDDDEEDGYVTMIALRDIPAGTELTMDYGPTYERRLQRHIREKQIIDSRAYRMRMKMKQEEQEEEELITMDWDFTATEEEKWMIRDEDAHYRLIPTNLPSEEDKRRRQRQKAETDNSSNSSDSTTTTSEAITDSGENIKDEKDHVMLKRQQQPQAAPGGGGGVPMTNEERVEWLKQHGVCVDTIYSDTITRRQKTRDGRQTYQVDDVGGFAKRYTPKGSIIMPSPVVVLSREDMKRYPYNPDEPLIRKQLDLANPYEDDEPLLEYTFDHPDSDLLLLPIAPMVNFLRSNKDGDDDDNEKVPNVRIEWPTSTATAVTTSTTEDSTKLVSQQEMDEWKSKHPLDVIDHSGKLLINYVAIRDIQPGEELILDGTLPDGFWPDAWIHKSLEYRIAPPIGSSNNNNNNNGDNKLSPGQVDLLRWEHNGEPVAQNMYRVGLPEGFSSRLKDFADSKGFINRYVELLTNSDLQSDQWQVFNKNGSEWFEHRYMNTEWNFNMVYMAAWNDRARKELLGTLGQAGFDSTLEVVGSKFGMENLTCFHSSFMGVSECDNSFIHADVYGVYEKGFNFIYPLVVVEGSPPELDVQTDDGNVQIGVNYEYDVGFALGDWVYHKTRTIEYSKSTDIRIVLGTYCSQVDNTNDRMMHHIYDGEDPAPFMDQFQLKEIHWSKGNNDVSLQSLLNDL